MNDETLTSLWLVAAAAVGLAAAVAGVIGGRLALGIAAGGTWNIASLWCLARLLSAWCRPRPSRRQVLGWFFLKFPLLYVAVFSLLRMPAVSLVGFSIGFSLVLFLAVGWVMIRVRRTALARPYGR